MKIKNKIENLIREFLWDGKKSKINREIIHATKDNGGLGLVDLEARNAAIKISWLKILENDNKAACLAYQFLDPEIGEDIWKCNINVRDVKKFLPVKTNSGLMCSKLGQR